tara:strand:+ start:344 stop:586 length:243 start_codon:yes stop_codon:yes gene_type:complete
MTDVTTQLTHINEKIETIEKQLNRIEDNVNRLITLSASNTESCEKMDAHIDFVDSVYNRLKQPLRFFLPMLPPTYNLRLR